jgi:TctA family transporter
VDLFADLGQGILALLTVQNVLLLAAGVLLGMIVGVMPGLGPSAGLAILLPRSTPPARSSCWPPSTTEPCTAGRSPRC